MRSQRVAQPRIRSAHASPCAQPAPSSIASSIEQLGPVEVADDRDVRRHARGGLVDRRQVVQVQDVGAEDVGAEQRALPREDLALELLVVERGHDRVGAVVAVLEARVHRDGPGERVVAAQRGGEVDDVGQEAGVEAAGVAVAVLVVAGAREDRHVPPVARERPGERAGDVRRAPARKEHQGGEDTVASMHAT